MHPVPSDGSPLYRTALTQQPCFVTRDTAIVDRYDGNILEIVRFSKFQIRDDRIHTVREGNRLLI